MSAIAAVLLAAGASRRMGARNKLLMPVGGEPMVRRAARVLTGSGIAELVVVLGHEARRVERALDGLPVRTVFNARYGDGQMTSVHAGLEAVAGEPDGVMVCLADQPTLTVEDVNALIRAFESRQRGDVVVPTFGGRRGNPIVLAGHRRAEILKGRRNLGCRHLVENNPDIVVTVPWDSDHLVADVDTPEDAGRVATAASAC